MKAQQSIFSSPNVLNSIEGINLFILSAEIYTNLKGIGTHLQLLKPTVIGTNFFYTKILMPFAS